MSNFNQNLGKRLKKIREYLGLTLEEVSDKMGFGNYQTLLSIESGTRLTKSDELSKFARIYHKNINNLLNFNDDLLSKVLWRGKSEDPKVKLKEQEFLKYCQNYSYLENKLGIVKKCNIKSLDLTPDDFDWNKVGEIATAFSRELQLGSRPACSLSKMLEEKCFVKILYLDLENYGSAASAVDDFGSAILINSTEPLWRRNFNLAHELFHLLTWDIFKHEEIHFLNHEKSHVEKLADCFAACLLLPTDDVLQEFKKKLNDNKITVLDIVRIAREFEVSTEALLWRLVGLKELAKDPVQALLDSNDFHNIDRTERKDLNKEAPFISQNYVGLAFKAYKEDLISKGKLAEFLGVSIGMVSSKLSEFGYGEDGIYDEELTAA